MSDLEQRVKILEAKVKILEETLKNMQLSEQTDEYIQSNSKSLEFMNLIDSMTKELELDFDTEEDSVQGVQTVKNKIDQQIADAESNSVDFSELCPDDPSYFNYEIESGIITDVFHGQIKDPKLSKYVSKGIRITSYNGFESDRVIVPMKIDGYPVISIGEKAFKHVNFSEIILPSSLKIILNDAFYGCKKLQHIDLPEAVEYLSDGCFEESGLRTIQIPDCIEEIPANCFCDCENLENVIFGNKIRELGRSAFENCQKLKQINLPETLQVIRSTCFANTGIKTLIIPSAVSEIANDVFKRKPYNNKYDINCVFLGKYTEVKDKLGIALPFYHVGQIYCLPGSKAQIYARDHSISMKPLSEFDLESI